MLLTDITVEQCKAYFNYTDSNRDTQIANMLPIAIDFVISECHHDFESKSRTEFAEIEDDLRTEFFLKNRPIASITSLTQNGTALVRNTDYKVDFNTGKVSLMQGANYNPIFASNRFWDSAPEAIEIVYVGGEALKQDVVQVVIEYVGIYCQINLKTYVDIAGQEVSAKYDALPKALQDILTKHTHYNYI